ncbi:MAG: hydrogenase maturation protease [Acidobacteria bacterium]|nr:hydrogenase maturation protease [Acidobacteriota bacterium]
MSTESSRIRSGDLRAGPLAGSDWLVVGVGTPGSGDDEIGLALVRDLSRQAEYSGRCRLLECADAAMVASALLDWQKPVVLVDAADMGLAPGEFRFFSDGNAALTVKAGSVSSHGLGLAEGLALARALGHDRAIRIFGVQPFDVSPKQGLTREMSGLFPSILAALNKACSRLQQAECRDAAG